MARLRNKTQGNFTIINNSILRNKELSIKERGLLCTLLSLPDNWEYSLQGLTRILPDGKDALRSSLQKLERMGYLKRIQTKTEEGQFAGYDWEIYETPQAEKPSSENPTTGKPTAEKATSEKPIQSINNLSRKKESNTHSINPSFIHQDEEERKEKKRTSSRSELELLMGAEALKDDQIASDLFELCVEVCDASGDIKLNGRIVPSSIFQSKIRKLYYEDLLRIADQIRNQTHEIKNIKNYMLAALYNEAVVSNTYYQNKVAVDIG